MLRLNTKITFTKSTGKELVLDFCHDIEIESSWENMTKVAEITLPKKLPQLEGQNIFVGNNAVFRRGDRVKIEMGYFPELKTRFEGYISRVNTNIPLMIYCEDEMFTLKNARTTVKLKAPTLLTLIKAVMPSTITVNSKNILETSTLLNYSFKDVQVTEVLNKLKQDIGVNSYFRDGEFYCNFASNAVVTKTESFAFEETILNENDLEWREADDIPLQIKAVSYLRNNTKLTATAGTEDGAVRTYSTTLTSQAKLQDYANEMLLKVRYTGFSGTLETFGDPDVQFGDIANLTSNDLPERDGNYLIRDMKIKIGVKSGYRQFLGIDQKV